MNPEPSQSGPSRHLVAMYATVACLLAMIASLHLLGRAPPLPLMTLGIGAAAWFGGVRHGYVTFGLITVLAPVADRALLAGRELDDFLVFVVLSLGVIHGAALAYRSHLAEAHARDVLRAREASMRATIDGVPALIAYIDRDMRCVMHNRMYEAWFPGRRIDGVGMRQVVGDAMFAEMRPAVALALSGAPSNALLTMTRDGNAQHQFDMHCRPHRDADGTVLGVAILLHDITERQVSIDTVRASEARLRSLAMASAAIVWLADREGALIDAQGWLEYTGQERAAYRGDGWLAMIHPDDRDGLEALWREACSTGEHIGASYRLHTQDGGHRMVVGQGIPIRDDAGRIIEWIGTIRDIEDHYRLERDLRERERERDALLENVPHMVWIANDAGDIVFSNRRWHEYTGLRPQDHWKRATHPDDIERAEALWRHALETGEPLIVEKRFRRVGDGSYRWHLVQGVPIRDADGRVDRWYGSSVDIEDQKRAIATLAEANARISRFLAVLSHELRNPISGIVTASEVLTRCIDDDAVRGQTLQMMARQSRQLQRTIDDLLDISRVTEDRIELRTEHLDLARVLGDLVIDLRPDAERSGVVLVLAVADGWRRPPRVNADEIRLRQIFTNLITNAMKASRPGQTVRIEIVAPTAAGRCLVRVVDEGNGLSDEIRETLFEPFVQAEGWRRNGRGLGLSIARQLAGLHGGSLRVEERDDLRRGACFVLELPLADARTGQAPIAAPGATPTTPQPGTRILIIEDELDNARALQTLLEASGHRVDVVTDAERGLSKWQEGRHDVVLCDLALPGPLDGYDVARALRALDARPYLIAYSGYGQPQDLVRSREAGFDEHLVKPATLQQIVDAIARRR